MLFRRHCSILPLLAVMAFMVGCSEEESNPKTDTVKVDHNPPQLLADLVFKSPTLKWCVDDTARHENLTYVNELKTLKCSAVGHGLLASFLYFGAVLDGNNARSSVTTTEGIEQLTGLEVLDLSHNLISKIDLSALKKLKKLTIEDTILQELNLTNNSELQDLLLGCNPLYKLSLPTKSQLASLEMVAHGSSGCEARGLLASNVNDSEPLDFVEFKNIQSGELLAGADFGVFPLTYLNFKNQHQLERIVITNYSANTLRDIDFSDFNVPKDNKVHQLDLSANNLVGLLLSAVDGLEKLNVAYNSIVDLDLSSHTHLQHLSLFGNSLSSQTLSAGNSELISLDYFDAADISNSIRYFNKLESVTITGDVNAVDLAEAMPLLKNLRMNSGSFTGSTFASTLERVDFYRTHLKEFQPILPNAKYLGLTENALNTIDLTQAPKLEELSIRESGIKDLDLRSNTVLRALALSSSPIADDHLMLPESVESLFFSQLNLSEFNMEKLGVTQLKTLSLGSMAIKKIIVSTELDHFTDLTLSDLSIAELDLTPFSQMKGSLIIQSCSRLQRIKAEGLGGVNYARFDGLSLDDASKQLLAELLNRDAGSLVTFNSL